MMGIISASTGVIAAICTGKGKLSAYIFGFINTVLYAIISYNAKYYGEVMLNVMYFLPLQFYGFYVWSKHMNAETKEVRKRKMTWKQFMLLVAIVSAATLLYGMFLSAIGGTLPYVDSFSTVVSVVAMLVTIHMFAEQCLLWIAVNVVSIFMWGYAFFALDSESIATLMMWCVYLFNAIFMYIRWRKGAISEQNEV